MAASASVRQLLNNQPFTLLPQNLLTCVEERSELIRYELGARILSPEQLPPGLLVVLQGDVRLMARLSSKRVITIDRRGAGQLLGWVSLLRGQACELVQVSEPCVCLLIPVDLLLECWRNSSEFLGFFVNRTTPSELASSLLDQYKTFLAPPIDEDQWLKQAVEKSKVVSPEYLTGNDHERIILSSFVSHDGPQPGDCIEVDLNIAPANKFPLRRVSCPSYLIDPYLRESTASLSLKDPDGGSAVALPESSSLEAAAKPAKDVLATIASAEELGLIPAEELRFDQRFTCRVEMVHSMKGKRLSRHLPRVCRFLFLLRSLTAF